MSDRPDSLNSNSGESLENLIRRAGDNAMRKLAEDLERQTDMIETSKRYDGASKGPVNRPGMREWMQENGIPWTRENYLDCAYPDELPDPWTAEHEANLPSELQDWSNVTSGE